VRERGLEDVEGVEACSHRCKGGENGIGVG
jgi:hypothetical protein